VENYFECLSFFVGTQTQLGNEEVAVLAEQVRIRRREEGEERRGKQSKEGKRRGKRDR
jgi:hypothetical protein